MPITKLDRWNQHCKTIQGKQNMTRRANTPRPGALTSLDYKKFCDTCFEMWIRWRDGWQSVVSGRAYPWDYTKIHAGHYFGRGSLNTRYDPRNCHAITSQENYWQHLGKQDEIIKYHDFMLRTYGQETLDELREMSQTLSHWSIPDWMDKARELHTQSFAYNPRETKSRLDAVYRTIKEKLVLELIIETITKGETNE